jgi:hypothetical protein
MERSACTNQYAPGRSPAIHASATLKRRWRIATTSLSAVDSEWKLIAATHNLLKLWQHAKHALA